jgi:hypothetical protein
VIGVSPRGLGLEAIEVWFQDGARVGQRGALTRIWAAKGGRPRAVRQQQFQAAYVFGAVCPAEGKAAALVMPKANSDSMQRHLDLISTTITPGKHGVLVADRAAWHMTGKLLTGESFHPAPAALLARAEPSRTSLAAATAIRLGKPMLCRLWPDR